MIAVQIDTRLTEELKLGRRQTVNKVYMYEGTYLLSEAAVRAGYTTREVETALRRVRMAARVSMENSESQELYQTLGHAVDALRRMGGIA